MAVWLCWYGYDLVKVVDTKVKADEWELQSSTHRTEARVVE